MKTIITTSTVTVIGYIWMPVNVLCSYTQILSPFDLESAKDEEENRITRDSLEHWVMTHFGDFSSIVDFKADLELDGDKNVIFDWKDEESEDKYLQTVGEEI